MLYWKDETMLRERQKDYIREATRRRAERTPRDPKQSSDAKSALGIALIGTQLIAGVLLMPFRHP